MVKCKICTGIQKSTSAVGWSIVKEFHPNMMLVGFYLPVRLGGIHKGKHKNTWVGKSLLVLLEG